jgi:hypothetical protein
MSNRWPDPDLARPHGQSNGDQVASHPGAFKPTNIGPESWEGNSWDPSVPETHAYLKALFNKLTDWGYEYFKIDGQPVVVGEYKRAAPFMKNKGDPETLYRKTIETIRGAIGPKRFLLGCWGTPLEGVGFMDGCRTGGDVVLGWGGFQTALRATMRWYFTHNIVWYADPDTMLLRTPLTIDQARVWPSSSLTGQALMSSDRLMDLRGTYRAHAAGLSGGRHTAPGPISSARNKRVWDLKIRHLAAGTTWSECSISRNRAGTDPADWKDWAGRPGPVHVFDFWNREYLGAWEERPGPDPRTHELPGADLAPRLGQDSAHFDQPAHHPGLGRSPEPELQPGRNVLHREKPDHQGRSL